MLSSSMFGAQGRGGSITHLTTEYLSEPLGVDKPNPRFSWRVALKGSPSKANRGLAQGSYQVQVSTDDAFSSLVWDSEQVKDKSTAHIAYNGTALKSDTKYYWRVHSGLYDGSLALVSPTASFRTGLNAADWSADWITGGDTANLLRKEFSTTVEDGGSATLFVSGVGYAEVQINGAKVGDGKLGPGWSDNTKRDYYETFDVTSMLTGSGKNAIGTSLGNGSTADRTRGLHA
jgi:alpha-L-rhamnosidase